MHEGESSNGQQGLRKDVGLVAALSLVVGMVLGAGAFMKPPAVLSAAGDSTGALAAWVIGGVLSMAGGLTLCELGVLFPRTGGVFVYLEELYGKKTAFLYGWMIITLFGPATVGALTGYFSSVFCLLFDIRPQFAVVVSAGVLAFVVFVNSIGVRQAGWLQTAATFCKLIPIVLLTVFGLWKGNGQVLAMSSGAMDTSPFSVAVLATLFAYDGWAQVASLAGEMSNPGRILPQAIIGGVSFLSIVYIAINVALLKVLPAEQMVALGHDASSIAAQKLFGLIGGNLISVGIMISIIGGLNGYTMTLSRTIFVMGERGQIPGSILWRKIDPDSQSPLNAMFLLLGLSYLYYRLLDADRLTDIAMFSIWIFYLITFVGVFVARRTHVAMPRSYKVPLYPFVPAAAIGGAAYVLFGMITTQFANAVLSIGLTLAGLPVYYYYFGEKRPAGYLLPRIRMKYVILVCSILVMTILGLSVKMFDTRPEIKIGVEPSAAPFAFEMKGNLTGFDIELVNAVAERVGMRVTYRAVSLENIFEAIDTGYVDAAVGSLSITPERQKNVGFSRPYIEDGGLVLLTGRNLGIKSPQDLAGRRVGVRSGSTGEIFAKKIPNVLVRSFQSSADLVNDFSAGALDAIIHDRLILEYIFSKGPSSADIVTIDLQREFYAIAYGIKNRDLGEKINKALDKMQENGEINKLREKWFGIKK